MAFNDTSKINISLKKLSGKAHTSNDKGLANEALPSGITSAIGTIFGESIPSSPTTTDLYDRSGTGDFQVELVRFEVDFITGTDTNSGRHAFKLKLPSTYEDGSDHGPSGAYLDDAELYSSNGALQLVPPSFGANYEAKPFYGGSATKNSGTQIPVLDARDWTIDYYNGILFQQDPPGTGDHAQNPDFVEAFLYIGDYLDTVVSNSGGVLTLTGLTDTNLPSPADGQVLTYNNSNSKWESQDVSGGGIERYSYSHSGSSESAETDITISGMDFTGITPTNADTKLYLNGQLLTGGTTGEVSSATVDYAFNNNTQVRFVCDIDNGDQIIIFYTTTSFSTGKPFLLHTADSSFDSARVISAGDGISITTSNPTEFIINNTGLIQRTKVHQQASQLHNASSNPVFSVSGIDMSTVSYTDSRIDIFIEGILKIKDVDYQLKDVVTSLSVNEFKLIGSAEIQNSKRVTVIIF